MIETFHNKRTYFYAKLFTLCIKRSFASFGKGSEIRPPFYAIHGLKQIHIGHHTTIGQQAQLTAWGSGSITIGNNCYINRLAHFTASNNITIGDNFYGGTNALITDNSHGDFTMEHLCLPPAQRPIVSKGPVHIGNNVWIGNNVCIMPSVTIGDNVTIAANSVVTHDIPSYSLAAGIPAKIIKQLPCHD